METLPDPANSLTGNVNPSDCAAYQSNKEVCITPQKRFRSQAVSKGSLDPDDLWYRCFGFICKKDVSIDWRDMELLAALERQLAGTVYYGKHEDGRKKRIDLLINDVFTMLAQVAPNGFFFGIHPGDPGRVGFWPQSLRFSP